MMWLLACTDKGVDSQPDDTGPGEDTAPTVQIVLFADDPANAVSAAWVSWFEAIGEVEVYAASDEAESWDRGQVLTVLLPDLGRSSKNSVEAWTPAGTVLAMGLGGARAYDGLGLGIGYSDGGQGAVDGLSVAEGYEGDAIFAGADLSDGPIIDVFTLPVTDVGIRPGAEGLTVLGWDDRYPGDFADLCYVDRYWYWGWGSDEDGTPDQFTEEGLAVWTALITRLMAG